MYHPTKYWHKLDDGRVQCDVCPRACKMHDGQRGLCFVRGVEGGEVRLYTYGRSSGFCVDPIDKKPLNHFLPGTSVLSFGTAGCNLAASSVSIRTRSLQRRRGCEESPSYSPSATTKPLMSTAPSDTRARCMC
jgi:AmmeMemoRadiSam system radical SAM enzyme